MANYMSTREARWLGSVPADWSLVRLGSLFTLRNQKVSDRDYRPLSVSKGGIVPQMEGVAKSDASDDRKLVLAGDFVINSRSDRKGSCGVSEFDGSVSLINLVLQPKKLDALFGPYLNYLLKNHGFSEEFYRWGHGIVADLWTTRWQEMKSILLPLPSFESQQRIASYLAQKCAQIDRLIEIEKAQIDKLNSYRVSLITNIVCNGILGGRKKAGTDWFPVVSENAQIAPVVRFYEIVLGKMLSPTKTAADQTLEPYYCAANIHFDSIEDECLKTMWFAPSDKETYLVTEGDLMIVEGGAGAGGANVAPRQARPTFIQNSVMLARGKNPVFNRWLYYVLYSLVKRGYVDYICNKATIPHFTKEKLSATSIVFLPESDMLQAVMYLDQKCSLIDSIVRLKETKINVLIEYKQSLIFECVTGKKEIPA